MTVEREITLISNEGSRLVRTLKSPVRLRKVRPPRGFKSCERRGITVVITVAGDRVSRPFFPSSAAVLRRSRNSSRCRDRASRTSRSEWLLRESQSDSRSHGPSCRPASGRSSRRQSLLRRRVSYYYFQSESAVPTRQSGDLGALTPWRTLPWPLVSQPRRLAPGSVRRGHHIATRPRDLLSPVSLSSRWSRNSQYLTQHFVSVLPRVPLHTREGGLALPWSAFVVPQQLFPNFPGGGRVPMKLRRVVTKCFYNNYDRVS